MLTETGNYDELYRDFRWDIPARFNMADACCDRHADGSNRLALIYVDEDGSANRTSFDEMRAFSSRFANVLAADGLARGDRVAVFLSQSLELPIVHLAAWRSGTGQPSLDGPLVYIDVTGRLDDAIQAVEPNGGRVMQARHSIGPYGWRAIVADSEGNRVALHSRTA